MRPKRGLGLEAIAESLRHTAADGDNLHGSTVVAAGRLRPRYLDRADAAGRPVRGRFTGVPAAYLHAERYRRVRGVTEGTLRSWDSIRTGIIVQTDLIHSDAYLERRECGELPERPGPVDEVAAAVVAEIEAEWEPARRRRPRPDEQRS